MYVASRAPASVGSCKKGAFTLVPSEYRTRELYLGTKRFPKVRTDRPDRGRIGHFENEIGFSQEFLIKSHLLRSCFLGFDLVG